MKERIRMAERIEGLQLAGKARPHPRLPLFSSGRRDAEVDREVTMPVQEN